MAHELDFNADGTARMFSKVTVPWHKLGTVLDKPPSSSEAIKYAGMAWSVEKRKLFWEVPPKAGQPDVYIRAEVPNRVALVRDEDEQLLSVVSPEYQVLQNADAFAWFDPIVQAGQAEYETAGVLCGGRKIWIMAKLATKIIVGEEYKQYMLMTNGHDGSTGVSISPVNTRVVCANTVRMAMSEGNQQWFNHTGNMQLKLDKAKQMYGLAQQQLNEHAQVLERFAAEKMTDDQFKLFLKDVLELEAQIPDEANILDGEIAKDGTKYQLAMRDRIMAIAENADGGLSDKFLGTAYGAFNAITHFVDHNISSRVRDSANYQLFGEGQKLKERAYNNLCELCNI